MNTIIKILRNTMILDVTTSTHKLKPNSVNDTLAKASSLLTNEVSIPFIPLFNLNINNIIIIKDFLESFEDGSWLDKAQNNVEKELSKWK